MWCVKQSWSLFISCKHSAYTLHNREERYFKNLLYVVGVCICKLKGVSCFFVAAINKFALVASNQCCFLCFLFTPLNLLTPPSPNHPLEEGMFLVRFPLLAMLVSLALCQYDDYEYPPASHLGPSGPNCAQECDCPYNFPSAMYCDGRNLKTVPKAPTGIKYLYLQNNQIQELKAGVFDNVTDLRWLVLDHNQITTEKVAKGTIDKLISLEKLFFSYNYLTGPVIPASKHLDELKMTNNKLTKFPTGLLSDKENLTSIHLQNNELTSEGVAGAFKGLKKLLSLDLSHNKLKKLPAGVPNSLEILYADHNQIDSVSAGYLNKLPVLQYLRLSHNKLVNSGIPAGVFNASSLVELDLSFNRLTAIPEVNEMLEQLYLQANEISKFDLDSFCKVIGPLNYSRLKHLRLDANNLTSSSMPHDAPNCLRQASDIMFE